MTVLRKTFRATFIQGTPGSTGYPGQPFKPAWVEYERYYHEECVPCVKVGEDWLVYLSEGGYLEAGTGDLQYLNLRTQPVIEIRRIGQWMVRRIEHPAQPYIAPVPPVASIPDKWVYEYFPGWNAGAASIAELIGSGDFTFQMEPGVINAVVGLAYSTEVSGTGYDRIRYGFQFTKGLFRVLECGSAQTGFMAFGAADTFRVRRRGWTVTYWQNSSLVYTHTERVTALALQADSSLWCGNDAVLGAAFTASGDTAGKIEGVLMPIGGPIAPAEGGDAWLRPLEAIDVGNYGLAVLGFLDADDGPNRGHAVLFALDSWEPIANVGDAPLKPLKAFGTDYDYAWSDPDSTLAPLEGYAEGGLLAPDDFSRGEAELCTLLVASIGLTGEIGGGDAALKPLQSTFAAGTLIQFAYGAAQLHALASNARGSGEATWRGGALLLPIEALGSARAVGISEGRAQLVPVQASGTGTLSLGAGWAVGSLVPLTATGAGGDVAENAGNGALVPLQSAGTGTLSVGAGWGLAELGALTALGTGHGAAAQSGCPQLAALQASGSGWLNVGAGWGAAALVPIEALGVSDGFTVAFGTPDLAALRSNGQGTLSLGAGRGAPALLPLWGVGTGSLTAVTGGTAKADLAPLRASASGVLRLNTGQAAVTLAPLVSAGTGATRLGANGRPVLLPLVASGRGTLSLNAGRSAATLPPLQANGAVELLTDAFGTPRLLPLRSAGTGMRLTVGGNADLPALMSLGRGLTARSYAEARPVLHELDSDSFLFEPAVSYLFKSLTTFSLTGVARSGAVTEVWGDLPELTLTAYSTAGRVEAACPVFTLSASAQSPNVGWWSGALPVCTLTARGLSGSAGELTATVHHRCRSIGQAAGRSAGVWPTLTLSGSVTGGSVAALQGDLPVMTLDATDSSSARATLSAALPWFYAAYGSAVGTLPRFTFNNVAAPAVIGTAVEAWAVNTAHGAVTHYPSGFTFLALGRLGTTYYGLKSDGLYRLGGATDNGAAIASRIKLHPNDFGTQQHKRVPYLYVGGADEPATVMTGVGGAVHGPYPIVEGQQRARLARGPCGILWDFEIIGEPGHRLRLNKLEFNVSVTSRKV